MGHFMGYGIQGVKVAAQRQKVDRFPDADFMASRCERVEWR